jgi:hypothetical protein
MMEESMGSVLSKATGYQFSSDAREESNASRSLAAPIQEMYLIKLVSLPWPISWFPNSFLELRQLRRIPSTADGLHEENAGVHPTPLNVDVVALVGQQYRLRGDDL